MTSKQDGASSTDVTRRRPPQSLEAERALIGTCLLTRDAIEKALSVPVEPSDFFSEAHRKIYTAILGLHAAGEPVDPVTVTASLNGDLGDKGKELVGRLFLDAPSSANALSYARAIREQAQLRRYLALASQLADAIFEGRDPAPILEQLHAPDLSSGTSWAEVDLAPILEGDLTPPEPDLFARDDGRLLLYSGVVHTFVGESESLKSWLALLAAAREITAGNSVIYLDFEDTPYSILGRLRALGAHTDDLLARFHYVRPEEPLTAGAINRLERITRTATPTLAIIDGVTEAMALEGLDPLDNAEVATWQARLPRRLANLGPAVVLIDHVTKSRESRGRYAIGAQHKLAGIYVQYVIDPIRPLAHVPEGSLDPITGISKITVEKDRYGAIRGFAANRRHIGELHLTAYPDGGVTGHIYPAREIPEGGFRPAAVMERISKTLEKAGTPLSKRAIYAAVKAKQTTVDLALELLEHGGYLTVEPGPRRALHHQIVRRYRQNEDPELHTDDDQETSYDAF